MTSKVTNADLQDLLYGIKEDIGNLKATTALQLQMLTKHDERLDKLDAVANRQRGAVTVWGIVATGAAAAAGTLVNYFRH